MEELIARLEAATGSDRLLDAQIYILCDPNDALQDIAKSHKLAKHDGMVTTKYRSGSSGTFVVSRYTDSIDAGKSLIRPDYSYALGNCNEDNQPWACITTPDGKDFAATAATEELALCIAALRWRMG